ncbi:MAG: hypothetical protein AAF298_10200 [Cyanobacteria bacterium P01_A01_bin.40]
MAISSGIVRIWNNFQSIKPLSTQLATTIKTFIKVRFLTTQINEEIGKPMRN